MAICKGEEYGEILENGSFSFCFLNGILFEIFSVFLFLFGCLRIRFELSRSFPGSTTRQAAASIGSHFWSGFKTAFKGWKLYRFVIPLHLVLLIFPPIVNFVYSHTLQSSTLIGVPPLGLLMFTAISSTLAWIWSLVVLIVEQQSEALGHPFARKYFWTLPTFWALQFIFVANNAWALHIKQVGGAPFWVTILYILPTAVLATYGLFKHQTTSPHQNPNYQPVVESLEDEEEDSLHDPKKNLHPSESASFFSKLYLIWLNPLLLLGYNRPLEETDIYTVPSRMRADDIGEKFEENWNKEKLKPNPALFGTVLRTLGFRVVWPAFLKLIYDLLAFVGPNIIGLVIRYLQDPDIPAHYGYIYVAIMLCSVLAQSLLQNHYFFAMFGTGIQTRAALTAIIYKKAFLLSSKSRQKSTIGEIVNHQAIDARRVQDLMPWFHLLWSNPLQIAIAMVLLYRGLGVSMLSGFAIMAMMLPINFFMAKWQSSIQTQNMERKDVRIKLLNEVVNAIRVIKIFAWEDKFANRIYEIRDHELLAMKRGAYFLAVQTFLWVATPLLVSMATFGTYVLLGNELTAEHVFTSLSLFNVLRQPLNMLPEVINRAVGARVSLKRIRAYLLSEEVDANAVQTDVHNKNTPVSVQIKDGSFKWSEASDIHMTDSPTLQNINVKIPNGKLVAIVGKVGSGKTSFLSSILGDIPKLTGSVSVNGRIAYVSQDPWIQNASVRENITMGALGRTFDTEKYNQTVSVCQLARDLQILPNGDSTEIGEKGINLSGGQKQRVSLARAVYSDADVYLFDDCLSAVDAQVGQSIFENCIKNQLENKTRIFVTHQLQFLNRVDYILVIKDGQITESGSYDELMSSQGEFQALVNEFISHEIKEEEKKEEENSEEFSQEEKKEAPKMKKLMTREDRETGTVNIRIYKQYLLSLGSALIGIILFATFTLEFSGKIGTDLWLSYWSSLDVVNRSSVRFYLTIYFVLGGTVCLLVLFRSMLCFLRAIVASRNLHNAMLNRVLRAPLSFFDTTPIGRILNRFSKDQQTIDEELPESLSDLVTNVYNVISILFVIAFVTPFFIAILLPLSALYRYIQKYYLQSSREIKRLDSITRSPIFAQMSETLSGVKTIRAFGLENDFIVVNNRKIDVNTSVQYCNVASNRWLSVRLESVSGSVVSCAALFAVLQRGSIDPGFAGLSIVYALQLTNTLNGMVRNYSLVETNLISVERVMKYSELPSEAPPVVPSKRPPSNWPQSGSIEFKNVQLRYREGLDLVLKNTTFEVKPQEKIGIVGRTGAGKSSLMVALFRLVELSGGSIVIDGIDISDIGLNDLRSKLSMIPQDPTLFEGTIRSNMDPFEEYTDDEIWKSLESVHMKDAVAALPQKLENNVTESGQNFSTGQRQLFCLGRALLRKSKVLVLDEATASVDFETDSLIQNTIRQEFQDCTVLTIAHRINTILDSDRVMVMDSGSVAEYDKPSVLMQNPNSRFAIMLKHQSNVKSNYQTK